MSPETITSPWENENLRAKYEAMSPQEQARIDNLTQIMREARAKNAQNEALSREEEGNPDDILKNFEESEDAPTQVDIAKLALSLNNWEIKLEDLQSERNQSIIALMTEFPDSAATFWLQAALKKAN